LPDFVAGDRGGLVAALPYFNRGKKEHMRRHKVIGIVGAGIGGIAAGIALIQAGFTVKIFEKAGQLREAGAGVSLWPNGTMILSELGLLPGILQQGQIGTHFLLRARSGELLMNISTAKADTPTVCLHRADLLRVLAEAIPAECLSLDHELTGVKFNGQKVCLQFRNQNSFVCDGVVGADGIHSRLRTLVGDDRRPSRRGYLIFRGLADAPGDAPIGHNGESWGAGHRFGTLAIGKKRVCWYATANTSALRDSAEERKPWLQEIFKAWHDPIPKLLATTDPSTIMVANACDLGPFRQGGGPVTLLGDAAHALTPNLGQGACIALEDALVLARCVSSHSSFSAAVRRYESLRFPHARSAVLRSRWLGDVGQWENSIAVWMRNFVTRRLPAQLFECHATFAEHMAALTGQMTASTIG
jgi:2-polyprenyl-6-methoxyphenol hydroxylase-like FAD-dependent oxidoreductase